MIDNFSTIDKSLHDLSIILKSPIKFSSSGSKFNLCQPVRSQAFGGNTIGDFLQDSQSPKQFTVLLRDMHCESPLNIVAFPNTEKIGPPIKEDTVCPSLNKHKITAGAVQKPLICIIHFLEFAF